MKTPQEFLTALGYILTPHKDPIALTPACLSIIL